MPRWIGSDQTLQLGGLYDEIAETYLNGATVTAVMKDAAGTEVAGQSWPLTLSYVAASNGIYRGTLEDGQVLVPGNRYIFELTADLGGDTIYFWRWSEPALYRTPA